MVAAIAIIKAEMAEDCGDPSPGANQLLDAAVRARVLAALKCHQRQVHRLQSGLHSRSRKRRCWPKRALALKQDADLASSYAHPHQVWQAKVDFLTYLDEHAAHAHYANNQILFDDPAEAQATQDLLTRLKAVSQ
jgi:hypothetical protein